MYCLISIIVVDIYYRYKAFRLQSVSNAQSVFTKYNFPFGIPWIYGLAKATTKNLLNERLKLDITETGRLTVRNEVISQFLFMTSDPENLKAILATQFEDFNLGDRYKQMYPLLGDGIFTLDGGGWYHSRLLLRPQFSREQVSHVIALEGHVQSLMKRFINAYSESQKINLNINNPLDRQYIYTDAQELFLMLSMDSATEFFFGESVNLLTGGNPNIPNAVNFGEAFDIAQAGLMNRAKAQKLYYLINSKKFRDACKTCKDLTEYYVKSSIDRVKAMEKKGLQVNDSKSENTQADDVEANGDIKNSDEIKISVINEKTGELQLDESDSDDSSMAEAYIFLDELAKVTDDVKVLRDQALSLLIAGRDTVASLLSWLFYSLALNHEIFEKLRAEVLKEFGTGTEKITFGSLKRCRYLQHTINETLRLYPTVPSNVRTATKDTTLPRGGGPDENSPIFIPKGANVLYHIYGVHRNPEFWGPDAEVFRPERWAEPNAGRIVNHPWAYLPFNGGPRICLGQQYALTEASYVTVRFLQTFKDIKPAPELLDGDSKEELQLTLTLKGGLPLLFTPDSILENPTLSEDSDKDIKDINFAV